MLTVGGLTDTTEAVTAYDTLEATALAGADDGDKLPFLEHVLKLHLVAGIVLLLEAAELSEMLAGMHAGLLEVTRHGLAGPVLLAVTESHLHGGIAVLVRGFDLRHHAGPDFQDSTGQVFSCLVVHAGHTDLFSNQSRHVTL